jgi:hypothetical protein
MPEISKFLRGSGRRWLTAERVRVDDILEVVGEGEIDEETFTKPYLILPVRYEGEELWLRIGVRNARRLADAWGTDTARWVGKRIKVVALEEYPGLGRKGMVLSPAEEEPAEEETVTLTLTKEEAERLRKLLGFPSRSD